jgi:hypothetical protein
MHLETKINIFLYVMQRMIPIILEISGNNTKNKRNIKDINVLASYKLNIQNY